MENGQTFEQSLRTREFEDDDPNFTPRISGIIEPNNGGFDYSMSILKSADGNPQSCQRYTFSYNNSQTVFGIRLMRIIKFRCS